jgi:signal transduction histidine kinase
MTKITKLQIMVGEALDYAPDSPKVTAAIDAMATWFEIVMEDMGIQPSAIPALVRWQYLHGQLMLPDND